MSTVRSHIRHLKNGKVITVRAHNRKGDARMPYVKNPNSTPMVGAELKQYMDRQNDYHFLGAEKIAEGKKFGVVSHPSGHAFYYDNAKHDFYVYSKDGKVYLKKSKRDQIQSILV